MFHVFFKLSYLIKEKERSSQDKNVQHIFHRKDRWVEIGVRSHRREDGKTMAEQRRWNALPTIPDIQCHSNIPKRLNEFASNQQQKHSSPVTAAVAPYLFYN